MNFGSCYVALDLLLPSKVENVSIHVSGHPVAVRHRVLPSETIREVNV